MELLPFAKKKSWKIFFYCKNLWKLNKPNMSYFIIVEENKGVGWQKLKYCYYLHYQVLALYFSQKEEREQNIYTFFTAEISSSWRLFKITKSLM